MIYSPFILRFIRIEKEERNAYSLGVFSIMATVIFGTFAIKPSITTAVGLIEKVSIYSKIDNDMTQKLVNLKKAHQNFERLKEERLYLQDKIPDNKDEYDFVRETSYVAAKSSVVVPNISFAKDVATSTPFSLSCNGKFSNLVEFLGFLQNSHRAINISFVNFSNKSYDREATLSIEGNFYHL